MWRALALVVVLGAAPAMAQDGSGRRARAEQLTEQADRLAEAGDRVSAAGYYRDAIRADPTHGPAYAGLGYVELHRGRTSDALEVFETGLSHSPATLELWIGDAEARLAGGDARGARARMARMAARFADDARAHRERAHFAERLFSWAEALAAYRALLALGGAGQAIDAAWIEEARAHAAALRMLLGEADPLARCEGSAVRAALCGR